MRSHQHDAEIGPPAWTIGRRRLPAADRAVHGRADPATDVTAAFQEVHFPAEPGAPITWTVSMAYVKTSAAPDPNQVRFEDELTTPSDQTVNAVQIDARLRENTAGSTLEFRASYTSGEPGPYVIRLLRFDGPQRRVLDERQGWLGPAAEPPPDADPAE